MNDSNVQQKLNTVNKTIPKEDWLHERHHVDSSLDHVKVLSSILLIYFMNTKKFFVSKETGKRTTIRKYNIWIQINLHK